jgi:hypothetical protein
MCTDVTRPHPPSILFLIFSEVIEVLYTIFSLFDTFFKATRAATRMFH